MSLDYLNPFPPALILPSYLVAGDTWVFTLSRGPYTGTDYTASMQFAAGPSSFVTQGVGDENYFTFTFDSTQTAVAPGPYRYTMFVTDADGNRTTVQTGGVPVLADPASAAWTKTESFLRQGIRKVEALLLELWNQKVEMVSFGGKQYYLRDADKLWKQRNELMARAVQEEAAMLGNRRANVILPLFVNR